MDEAGIKRRGWHEARGYKFEKPSKEELEKWYYEENKTLEEIAKKVGVNKTTVSNWFKDMGIPTKSWYEARRIEKKKPKRSELKKLYVEERKSINKIAFIFNVAPITVSRWLDEYNIEKRDLRDAQFAYLKKEIEMPPSEKLYKLYVGDRKSTKEIGRIFRVTDTTVNRWLELIGVLRRDQRDAKFAQFGKDVVKPSDEELLRMYHKEKMSTYEIADKFGVSQSTVCSWLKEAGVDMRPSLYGYNERLVCDDGHRVRSIPERIVDNWLFQYGIEHTYDEKLPGPRMFRCDFRVKGFYIEIRGLSGKGFYDEKMELEKIPYYKKHGLNRIDIFPEDFDSNNSFIRKLEPLLKYSDPKLRRQRQIDEFKNF